MEGTEKSVEAVYRAKSPARWGQGVPSAERGLGRTDTGKEAKDTAGDWPRGLNQGRWLGGRRAPTLQDLKCQA